MFANEAGMTMQMHIQQSICSWNMQPETAGHTVKLFPVRIRNMLNEIKVSQCQLELQKSTCGGASKRRGPWATESDRSANPAKQSAFVLFLFLSGDLLQSEIMKGEDMEV